MDQIKNVEASGSVSENDWDPVMDADPALTIVGIMIKDHFRILELYLLVTRLIWFLNSDPALTVLDIQIGAPTIMGIRILPR